MLGSSNTKVERKKRKDAGKTLINSENKRRSVYTPRFVFAKLLRQRHPDTLFSKDEIDQAWTKADDSTKKECTDQANEWLQQGPFLVEELHKALQSTAGSVSWTTVATLVSGSGNLEMIGETAIREFVMSLPDSSYKATRILPKLDKANKQRRLWWAHQFWIFWQSAVTFNEIQIILAHMACGIAECKGGDSFVRERGGLHCHVRNCCVTVCDETGNPIGVEVVSSYDAEPAEGDNGKDATHHHKLRYSQPDLEQTFEENLRRMTEPELECLFEGLPADHEWFDAVAEAYAAFDPRQRKTTRQRRTTRRNRRITVVSKQSYVSAVVERCSREDGVGCERSSRMCWM